MAKDSFDEAVSHVPEEQRRLLEKMMELKLVTSFAWSDKTGQHRVVYTPKGRDFLKLIDAVSAPEPDRRQARLLALDALAVGGFAFGGFKKE
jgi:hypothetical protein